MENNFLPGMGERIKQLRKQQRLSQEELAEKADIAKQSISLIEHGKQEIRAGTVISLADALGVTTDYLLKGTRTDTDNMRLDRRLLNLSNEQYNYISEVISKFVDLCEKTNNEN